MPKARVKVNGKWYDIGGMTAEEKTTYDNQIIQLQSDISATASQIQLKVDQTTFDTGLQNTLNTANAYADNISSTLNQAISDVNGDVGNLDSFMNGAFKDGILYDSEQKRLQGYINQLQSDNAELTNRYDLLYNDSLLVDDTSAVPPITNKADLLSTKTDYDNKFNALLNTIDTVTADTRIDDTERAQVDAAYQAYIASIGTLSAELQKVVGFIAQKKADIAQTNASGYADGLVGPLDARVSIAESSITENSTQIATKVSQTDYNYKAVQDNWYNFVKSNAINMIGDLQSLTPPDGYSWVLGSLPDGSQGRILTKGYTAGTLVDNSEWLMPEIKVDPTKMYLMEFWVQAVDKNSQVYFGREEYKQLLDGTLDDNDQGNGPYMVSSLVATDETVGMWVKHYAVIPPHDAGNENDHTTIQSSYTPDTEYKFWNADTTYIRPKIYLTFGVTDTTQNSQMNAWGFGLYEIGSNINLYKNIEDLNQSMTKAQSDIIQNSNQIQLTVSSETYTSTVNDINNRITNVEQNVPYLLEILSSNGSVFRNGVIDTTLSAKVYNGTNDITDTIDATMFTWTRVSNDPTGDTDWNNTYGVGTKTISITSTDVHFSAMFQCSVSS